MTTLTQEKFPTLTSASIKEKLAMFRSLPDVDGNYHNIQRYENLEVLFPAMQAPFLTTLMDTSSVNDDGSIHYFRVETPSQCLKRLVNTSDENNHSTFNRVTYSTNTDSDIDALVKKINPAFSFYGWMARRATETTHFGEYKDPSFVIDLPKGNLRDKLIRDIYIFAVMVTNVLEGAEILIRFENENRQHSREDTLGLTFSATDPTRCAVRLEGRTFHPLTSVLRNVDEFTI